MGGDAPPIIASESRRSSDAHEDQTHTRASHTPERYKCSLAPPSDHHDKKLVSPTAAHNTAEHTAVCR
ncbi:hypothetical protein Q8A67_016931 [Cirrhinus molitorella]|uniref:Uncharacterized protein n=1 Tax=Cirrhinus molitorella TaxID=172907 RepID=A0AA88PHL7_9TELE|nr:hypothetical protein Q8A67_016931 [Cirrhinus molitorella]